MKKIYFALMFMIGLAMMTACGNKAEKADAENVEQKSEEVGEEIGEEVDVDAEAAVVAYEEYYVKYDDLMKRSEAGEEIFEELMALQETSYDISEKLITTESKRNANQKARVKAVEEKIDAWQKKVMGE